MNLIITLFASLSAVLTAFIFYYNLKIVRKFREDEELTATKLVIKERVPDAFMALSISSLFFSLGAFIGASLIILELEMFQYFSELGVITMLVGLLTFMKRIKESVTEGEKNEVENEEKKDNKEDKEVSEQDESSKQDTEDDETEEEKEADEKESSEKEE